MSHHCHDEHAGDGGHGHHHHPHDGGDGHDHSDDITPALQFSLYQQINFDEVETFTRPTRARDRPSSRRRGRSGWTQSPSWSATPTSSFSYTFRKCLPGPVCTALCGRGGGKAQLQTYIACTEYRVCTCTCTEYPIAHTGMANRRVTAQVKLHSILLRTSDSPSAPRTLRVFQNHDGIGFAEAEELKPAQEFELARTSEVQELPVRRALFAKVTRLDAVPARELRRRHRRHAALVHRLQGRVDAARPRTDQHPLRGGRQPERPRCQGHQREPDGERHRRSRARACDPAGKGTHVRAAALQLGSWQLPSAS